MQLLVNHLKKPRALHNPTTLPLHLQAAGLFVVSERACVCDLLGAEGWES